MSTRLALVTVAGLAFAAAASTASAANFSINWLNQSTPTSGPVVPFGGVIPSGVTYNDPNFGLVQITYFLPAGFVQARNTDPQTQNGTIISGPNTYTFGAHENFAATNNNPLTNNLALPISWGMTYRFLSGPVAAGDLVVGVTGLGATTSFGGGATTAMVFQSGTFLGDWQTSTTFGATQFTAGVNMFTLQNSVTAAGGANPNWNTALGVSLINTTVSTLSLEFTQLPGDGVGVNIGFVPSPGAAAVLAFGGLLAARRRR